MSHPDYTPEDLGIEGACEDARLILKFANEKRRKHARLKRAVWAMVVLSFTLGLIIENGLDLLHDRRLRGWM